MSLLLLFSQGRNASLAATEADDALAATAAVLIGATASLTEADDTVASTATVLVSATASITEADDSIASTAAVLVQATAAITEADDSVAATATVGDAGITVTAALVEDDDSLVATAAVSGVGSDAQGGTVGGGGGSRSTGGSPDRELRRYIQQLREAHEAGEVVARLQAVSIDTLSATALVGKSAMVSAKATNPRHDDEEAILVLLLAA